MSSNGCKQLSGWPVLDILTTDSQTDFMLTGCLAEYPACMPPTSHTSKYEYRITGCTPDGWRRTEWTARADAVQAYGQADWILIAFERREVGDDTTIQRAPKPSADAWTDVTTDTTHFVDEEVPDSD